MGKELVGWPISAAIESLICDKIICSTDNNDIANVAKSFGAEIPFIRPKALCADETPTSDVILHAIEHFEKIGETFDFVLLLEPTSPTTTSNDIRSAFKKLIKASKVSTSLVSVTENISGHPDFSFEIDGSSGLLMKENIENWRVKRRQEISQLFNLDGSLYISEVPTFKEKKTFVHEKTLAFNLPKWKSYEVDDEINVIIISEIIKKKLNYA